MYSAFLSPPLTLAVSQGVAKLTSNPIWTPEAAVPSGGSEQAAITLTTAPTERQAHRSAELPSEPQRPSTAKAEVQVHFNPAYAQEAQLASIEPSAPPTVSLPILGSSTHSEVVGSQQASSASSTPSCSCDSARSAVSKDAHPVLEALLPASTHTSAACASEDTFKTSLLVSSPKTVDCQPSSPMASGNSTSSGCVLIDASSVPSLALKSGRSLQPPGHSRSLALNRMSPPGLMRLSSNDVLGPTPGHKSLLKPTEIAVNPRQGVPRSVHGTAVSRDAQHMTDALLPTSIHTSASCASEDTLKTSSLVSSPLAADCQPSSPVASDNSTASGCVLITSPDTPSLAIKSCESVRPPGQSSAVKLNRMSPPGLMRLSSNDALAPTPGPKSLLKPTENAVKLRQGVPRSVHGRLTVLEQEEKVRSAAGKPSVKAAPRPKQSPKVGASRQVVSLIRICLCS